MPANQFEPRTSSRIAAPNQQPDVAPDLFEGFGEKPPSSGQFSAASLAGLLMLAFELWVAPMVLLTSFGVTVLIWWLLDQPWSGRRRRSRRRGLTSRLLYLTTLMVTGLWLAVMFVFRASDPALSASFSATMPSDFLGGKAGGALAALNGMKGSLASSTAPVMTKAVDLAPFSLFAHGTVSTLCISLLAYAIVSGRRRLRRKRRDAEPKRDRVHTSPPQG